MRELIEIERFVHAGINRKRVDCHQVVRLTSAFTTYVSTFTNSKRFSGPSTYFHSETIRMLRDTYQYDAASAIRDDTFLDSLYATLACWGLHRMGKPTNQMVERECFVDTIRKQEDSIRKLQGKQIEGLSEEEVDDYGKALWEIISKIKIANNDARLVAGAKTLHHLLPFLLPPIDREYTLRCFFGKKNVTKGSTIFKQLFRCFYLIAQDSHEQIEMIMNDSDSFNLMNTSFTKVIDNAVVGYLLPREVSK